VTDWSLAVGNNNNNNNNNHNKHVCIVPEDRNFRGTVSNVWTCLQSEQTVCNETLVALVKQYLQHCAVVSMIKRLGVHDSVGIRHLRSSNYRTVAVPCTRTTLGDSYGQFRQHLKTHLFRASKSQCIVTLDKKGKGKAHTRLPSVGFRS